MTNFLDDLFRPAETDRIAENPWASGQAPSVDLPKGDSKDPMKDCGWLNVKSDF